MDLKKQEIIRIELVTVNGQPVKTIAQEMLPAGNHPISVDISDLAAGCYMYRVMAGNQELYGKLVVL
jgi:hypothetical protein